MVTRWFQSTGQMGNGGWSLGPGGTQAMLHWCFLRCSFQLERQLRRGDGKRGRREEEEKRGIQSTRQPVCPVANFQLLIRLDLTHSIMQRHALSSHIRSFTKGKIKLVQGEDVSSHLAISNHKPNIYSAYCHWAQVRKKVICTGGVRVKEQRRTMEGQVLFLVCLSQHKWPCVSLF